MCIPRVYIWCTIGVYTTGCTYRKVYIRERGKPVAQSVSHSLGRKGGLLRRVLSSLLGERETCCAESSLLPVSLLGNTPASLLSTRFTVGQCSSLSHFPVSLLGKVPLFLSLSRFTVGLVLPHLPVSRFTVGLGTEPERKRNPLQRGELHKECHNWQHPFHWWG